jgi:hypothetical protein
MHITKIKNKPRSLHTKESSLIIALILFLTACSNGGDSSSVASVETTGSCAAPSGAHTGCCSSHGGIGDQCSIGKVCYTASGKLVCSDGTISPTCIRSLNSEANEESPRFGPSRLNSDEELVSLGISCS